MRYLSCVAALASAAAIFLVMSVPAAALAAEKRNAPGVTGNEIVIGQTMPYSGAASAWGADGLAELAYFKMLNEQGGVNGRKVPRRRL